MPAFFSGTALDLLPLLGGFLGHSKMPREQRDLYKISRNAAQQLYSYGTGVPGSSPDEQAALAQQRAMLGEEQANQRNQLMGAMGANPQMGMVPDMLANLGSMEVAQRMNLSSAHMMNALAQRRQALMQAAGTAQGTAGLAQNPQQGNALPQLFGQLAQAYAYQKAYGRPGQGQGGDQGGGGNGFGTNTAGNYTGSWGFNTAPSGLHTTNTYNTGQSNGTVVAPGNEMGGVNGTNNQIRQGSGAGTAIDKFRRLYFGGGLTFG